MAYRVDKVAHQLREELSDILARLSDPRVGMVTIVEVDVSPDLRNALVKVSSIGDDAQRRARIEALEHARGFIKRELAQRLRSNLRHIPDVKFFDDRNIEYAVHIGQVLHEIIPEEPDVVS
jgi:ribosome-binding factor A